MDEEISPKKSRRWLKRIMIVFILFIIYAVTVIPVGMFLYSLKSKHNINIFSHTGYHAYAQCLREQIYKIQILEKNKEKEQDK